MSLIAPSSLSASALEALGVAPPRAAALLDQIAPLWNDPDPIRRWTLLTRQVLTPTVPFAVHRELFARNYVGWDKADGPAPAWTPSAEDLKHANLNCAMERAGVETIDAFAEWAAHDSGRFWLMM